MTIPMVVARAIATAPRSLLIVLWQTIDVIYIKENGQVVILWFCLGKKAEVAVDPTAPDRATLKTRLPPKKSREFQSKPELQGSPQHSFMMLHVIPTDT